MDKTLHLKRAYLDNCTMGKIYLSGQLICHTVEKPWLSNKKNVSCIPPGEYELEAFDSNKHKDCYALVNEELGVSVFGDTQRTTCLFHVANYPDQVEGCIGPGLELQAITSRWGVAYSAKAMDKLREIIGKNVEGWKVLIE